MIGLSYGNNTVMIKQWYGCHMALIQLYSYDVVRHGYHIVLIHDCDMVITWLSYGYHMVIIQVLYRYDTVMIRISDGYDMIEIRLWYGYHTVIIWSAYGYDIVIIQLWFSCGYDTVIMCLLYCYNMVIIRLWYDYDFWHCRSWHLLHLFKRGLHFFETRTQHH